MRGLTSLETRGIYILDIFFLRDKYRVRINVFPLSRTNERTKHSRAITDKGLLRLDIMARGKMDNYQRDLTRLLISRVNEFSPASDFRIRYPLE